MPDQQGGQQLQLLAPALVKQRSFVALIWTGATLGTIALALRYYARIKYFRRLLADDYFMIAPDFYEVMDIAAGLRLPTAKFEYHLLRLVRGQLAVLLSFFIGLWLIKASFLVFFYRLGNQVTYYRVAWWSVTVVTISTFIVCIATIPYECLAGRASTIAASCTQEPAIMSQDNILRIDTGLDVLTDGLIMALPISILWNVRISTKRRLALAGAFALVIVTMTISIIRVAVVTSNTTSAGTHKHIDSTWLWTWHYIESFVALLIACAASFRTLFVAKQQSQDAREAAGRHDFENRKDVQQVKNRAMKARMKHFQHSLFETEKGPELETVEVPRLSGNLKRPRCDGAGDGGADDDGADVMGTTDEIMSSEHERNSSELSSERSLEPGSKSTPALKTGSKQGDS